QAIPSQTSGADIAALQIFGDGPVRQAADAPTRGHQLHHHDGELGIAHGGRLYAGGIEKAAEDIQPVTFDRIADEGFPGQVPGLDKAAAAQRVLVADGQYGLVGEQRDIGQAADVLWVGGNDQVQLTAGQRGQGGEEVPGGKIHLYLRPDIAE